MKILVARMKIEDISSTAILFDAYRVFYKQQSDIENAKLFISERYNKQDSAIFIARDNSNKLVGFVQLYPSFTSVGMAKAWILNDLYIKEAYRAEGIATALINQCIKFGKETNCLKILLETGENNHAAQKLYDKMGFHKDSSINYEYLL